MQFGKMNTILKTAAQLLCIDSFADLYCSSSHATFCLCGDGSNMALHHTSICRNWYAEQFPLSACKFQLSEYRWNEFLDTADYFAFGRN